jgi:hypothetical protein
VKPKTAANEALCPSGFGNARLAPHGAAASTFAVPSQALNSQSDPLFPMFLRWKKVRGVPYLALVENYRMQGRVRQRTIKWLGRVDRLDVIEVRRQLATMPTFAFLDPRHESPRSLAPRSADGGGALGGGHRGAFGFFHAPPGDNVSASRRTDGSPAGPR